MSTPSPDARAVVAAVDRLTTQVRRLADTRPTPTDDATTTCDASTLGIANRHLGPCVLRDGHDGPVHRGPEGETWASVVAEAHTLADGTEAGFRAALAADDEEQQRTHRREQLRTLLARLDRGGLLSPGDCTRLRQHIDAEQHEADTLRAITADHRVETRALREKLERYGQEAKEQRERAEQAEAAIERVRAYAAETARFMKDGTNDHDIGRYDTAVCVLDALREDAERFDEQQPDENARLIAEYQAAVLRVLAVSDNPLNGHAPAGPEQEAYVRGWRFAIHEVRRAIESTEQPTTKEPS